MNQFFAGINRAHSSLARVHRILPWLVAYLFLLPLPNSAESNVSGHFSVENYSGHADSSLWSGSLSASISSTGANGPAPRQLKFTVPFQGGDDGIAPYQIKNIGDQILNTNVV